MFTAQDLHKTYHIGETTVHALRGVSVDIEPGEFVAIMGPSGSGKSTLMHVLGFLDHPDRGVLRFGGSDVTQLDEAGLARLRNQVVGFVFQSFNLLSRTTALDNVSLPRFYANGNGRTDPGRAKRLLDTVGLGDRLGHRPNQLSGGQQQRVAIARALINQPRVILADEPTGNLDSHARQEILDLLKRLHADGLTVILVTHDDEVARHATRIIRMVDGRIVSDERRAPAAAPVTKPGHPAAGRGDTPRRLTAAELSEHLRHALRMIASHKTRSLLSMLGVLIGVGCVIAMLALGRGARRSIEQELSRFGSNVLSVRPGSMQSRGVTLEQGAVTRLSLEDAAAIDSGVPDILRVAPQVSGQAQVAHGSENWSTRVLGTTPEYAEMRGQQPVAGRFFTREDVDTRRRVVVLGRTVVRELFGNQRAIGEMIKVNRTEFQVIGILPTQGSTGWRDQDDIIAMPLSTAMNRVLGREYVDQIDVQVASADRMADAQEAMRQLVIRRHRLTTPERQESFNIRDYTQIQETLASTTKTMSVLLGAVAGISLVVGGIGIMNIMLVSVTERTREIGLRKALGATPRDIRVQFLVESVVITFLGGMAGILLGVGASWLITLTAGWATVIGLDSILLAFIFSAAVGIVFGLWPAHMAARLDPIQALRYE